MSNAEDVLQALIESMAEHGIKHEVRRYESSFHHLDRPARKARIRLIMRLSHALVEAEKVSIQATALAEGILCDVVLGDLDYAVRSAKELFGDPSYVGLESESHLTPFLRILEELEKPDGERH